MTANKRWNAAQWITGRRLACVFAGLSLVGCESAPTTNAAAKSPAPAEVAKAAVPDQPTVVTAWHGTGPLDTNAFHAAGPAWNLHYKVEGEPNAQFQIFVYRADSGRMKQLAVDGRGASDGKIAVASAPGAYFLRVVATGPWSMDATDLEPVPTAAPEKTAAAPASAAAPAKASAPSNKP